MSIDEHSRPPLDQAAVQAAAERLGWRVEVTSASPSTNADAAAAYGAGAAHGLVLATEHQTAGRGRLGREWVTPERSSVTASFLLVPPATMPETRWPLLALASGIAAARAVRRTTGLQAQLKWPNDVLVHGVEEGGKAGGVLLERVDRQGLAAAVAGVGLNVSQSRQELPVPEATSLALAAGSDVDRTSLLVALVEEMAAAYQGWVEGDDLRRAYLDLCATVGQDVRVAVPGGQLTGRAVDVDDAGRLVVRTESGTEEHLTAGDVVHVRPVGGPEGSGA